MSAKEKLKKAVELTIAAGYQLDQEAFSFLTLLAATDDPSEVIGIAIKKLDDLSQKPFFVDKRLLKELLEGTEQPSETTAEAQSAQFQEEPHLQSFQISQVTEGNSQFQPYAKDVEKNVKIIEDSSDKISSNGTIEDFLEYFRDRFKRTERLLRQRIDVKSATSIRDALKAPANTKLKIIGLIAEKQSNGQFCQ